MSLLICNPRLDIERPPARWLTADQKRVLLTIFAINREGDMPRTAHLAAQLNMPLEDLKAILHVLGKHDLVRSTHPL